MSSLRVFAARILCGGRYFDFYRNTSLSCGTLWWTLSTTVWDVWQEHMRKGDRSIDAPATMFGVISYSPLRGAPWVLFGGSYFRRDKTMRDRILISSETRVE